MQRSYRIKHWDSREEKINKRLRIHFYKSINFIDAAVEESDTIETVRNFILARNQTNFLLVKIKNNEELNDLDLKSDEFPLEVKIVNPLDDNQFDTEIICEQEQKCSLSDIVDNEEFASYVYFNQDKQCAHYQKSAKWFHH
jgi:hypothetical protein